MSNVESAAAAGDSYNLRNILLADGVGAVVGSLLGSPFPPAVYIGHPGWKAVGGRIGYSLATGLCVALVCFLGLFALLLAVIPLVAILPILLYIGVVIGAQAFQATPREHAPAVILALIPNIASWGHVLVDGALNAAGTSADKVGMAALAGSGVVYRGMELLGGGAILAGMILGRRRRLHHRPRLPSRRRLRAGRRRAVILRLHPRRQARHRRVLGRGARLSSSSRSSAGAWRGERAAPQRS